MTAHGRKKILVADDTLPMRVMLQDVLSEAGYEVTTAKDGEEAWELLGDPREVCFDLLVLDLLMPRVTGFEILERLHCTCPGKQRILVITGIFKSDKEVNRLRDLGASGYITKSALVDEILFRVNQVFHEGQANLRRYPRVFMSIPVTYRFRGEQVSNYSSNFSAGGLFIRTIAPPPPDERIEISFQVAEGKLSIQAEARVAWNNEYETYRRKSCLPGMGVEFDRMDESMRESLALFVEEKLSKEPIWFGPK